MRLLRLFLFGGELKNGRSLRPAWQIAMLLPLYPAYRAADWFVQFMDERF